MQAIFISLDKQNKQMLEINSFPFLQPVYYIPQIASYKQHLYIPSTLVKNACSTTNKAFIPNKSHYIVVFL